MHYDFKSKFNKIDSQSYRNLRVPEIDWILNEAQELFVKMVAKPRVKNSLGFETSQRTIDDIRPLVVKATLGLLNGTVYTLPSDYCFYLRARAVLTKGTCRNFPAVVRIQQLDDEFEEDPFTASSFEWREVNGVFNSQGLQLFTDGTFSYQSVKMDYIKKLEYIHNAEDFRAGGYNLPSGIALTGTNDCILPEGTHREIVDLAVMLASANIQSPDWQQKLAKINLNIPLS